MWRSNAAGRMPERGLPRGRTPTLKDPFSLHGRHTDVKQEILAGIMGWMTVVSSVAFYAKLFVAGEEGVDQDATVETFELVAGLSSIAFGAVFNLPFIIAPSVLYAPRQDGVELGEHLADQFIANLAAAVFFALALKLSFVSYIPTALRLGAGCGISMLVSILGMRSLGLLVSDSFTLQPFTWQNTAGLAIITASCAKATGPANNMKKWMLVILSPMMLTMLVYAVGDRSKFQGYSSAANAPLSNWGDGTFGVADFSNVLPNAPNQHWFFIIRLIFSITINVSSVLLVLIDAVCLEEVHAKLKSSGVVDFSNAIGGTKKFRFMACSIPLMSAIGNLMGVTTQAAFVQSMIVVFAGGRSGLSAVVTGVMFLLSTVLWPLLPVLVPGHVSGALTVVISLRFLTVIRMIDVTRPTNLLMFGMSILLIPFSFDFVDALCIATVLGFLCESSHKLGRLWNARRGPGGRGSKVAATEATEKDEVGNNLATGRDVQAGIITASDTEVLPGVAERGGLATDTTLFRSDTLFRPKLLPSSASHTEIPGIAPAPTSPRGEHDLAHGKTMPKNAMLPPIEKKRKIKMPRGAPSATYARLSPGSPAKAGPVAVHWGLALAAAAQLMLSVIRDQTYDTSDD